MSERRRPDPASAEDTDGAHLEELGPTGYARDGGITYRAATAGPTHGLRLVAVLAIALIGVGVAAGFLPRSTAVGPSGSENAPSPAVAEGPPRTAPPLIPNPADPPLGELERCPGGTRTADIIDTSLPGNTTPHRAPGIGGSPTDVFRTGRIAVAIPGPANRAQIELVDPATSEACLLVELDNAVVRSMRWAPGMQALAIAASSDAANRQGIYIWSTAGSITRAATFDGPASLSFSPRESHLAIGGANLWLLASDGSPPIRLHCETPNSTDQCPEFPELLWSPDGQMIATSLGLAGHFVQPFGIASLEEGIFRPLRSGAAFPFDQGVKPLGWLDATGALIVYHPVPPHLVWIELGDPIRIGRRVDLA
jgi:hypothetical protein